MLSLTVLLLASIFVLRRSSGSNVTFLEIASDARFDGLVSNSGYLKQTRTTKNDKAQCGYSCIAMDDCKSYFIDTGTLQCQFHDSVLQDPTGLSPSADSLYFIVGSGGTGTNIQDVTCPPDWVKHEQSCYLFETMTMTNYADAKTHCQNKGGEVLRIDTDAESQFITQHLSTLSYVSHRHWLGLTDLETQGVWKWEANGNVDTVANWAQSQPENNAEHCAVIYKVVFQWHDVICGDMCHPACRIN